MSCREAFKLNLTQCLKIREDHYRSEDGTVDYAAESINSLIYKLQSRQAEKNNEELIQSFARMERATRNLKIISTLSEFYFGTSLDPEYIPF